MNKQERERTREQNKLAHGSTLNIMNMAWCYWNRPEWLREWVERRRIDNTGGKQ